MHVVDESAGQYRRLGLKYYNPCESENEAGRESTEENRFTNVIDLILSSGYCYERTEPPAPSCLNFCGING